MSAGAARGVAPEGAAMEFPHALQQALGFVRVLEHGADPGHAQLEFDGRPEFAHTGATIMQGGILIAWLDHAMAWAVAAREPRAVLASLEIKASYLGPTPPGLSIAEARVVQWGRSIVFLEATLRAPGGQARVRASSTGRLILPKG